MKIKERYRGRFLFKEKWISVCSAHQEYEEKCNTCQAGSWYNVNSSFFANLVYKIYKPLWLWWVNRPNSKARRNIEKHFPNLKK